MNLNQFINTGVDNATVNDMKKSIAREEDLQKAMNRAGLVQKDVQVRGKNGQTFTRKQWVKAGSTDSSTGDSSSSTKDIKVGDVLTVNGHSVKVLKVNDSDYTVKGGNEIVSHVSKRAVNDGIAKKVVSTAQHSATDSGKPNSSKESSNTYSPIKNDYSRLTSEKESGTIAGEAHNMMVGYLKRNGIDVKDSRAIKKAAMEMAKQYQDKANKKDAHPDDKKHNRKLSDEFSKIAASTKDSDKFSASNFRTLKENLADFGFKLDSADLSDIESGNPPDTITLFKGKEEFTATFNKYSDGGCEVINVKPVKNSQQSSSTRFKPSDFQFRAGGQEVANIVNEADEKFGVKKHSNGQVGFGTLNLNNGENVNFGYDDKGAYLQWQGQKFRSADELNTQWSGGKKTQSSQDKINHQTGVKDKSKATMIEDYFAGNHSHEDGKKALAGLLGKGYTREDIMAQAEKSGVTWKKNDHAGINWMRASMAIQKHLNSIKESSSNAEAKSNKTQYKTGTIDKNGELKPSGDNELEDMVKEMTDMDLPDLTDLVRTSNNLDVSNGSSGIESAKVLPNGKLNLEIYLEGYDENSEDYIDDVFTIEVPISNSSSKTETTDKNSSAFSGEQLNKLNSLVNDCNKETVDNNWSLNIQNKDIMSSNAAIKAVMFMHTISDVSDVAGTNKKLRELADKLGITEHGGTIIMDNKGKVRCTAADGSSKVVFTSYGKNKGFINNDRFSSNFFSCRGASTTDKYIDTKRREAIFNSDGTPKKHTNLDSNYPDKDDIKQSRVLNKPPVGSNIEYLGDLDNHMVFYNRNTGNYSRVYNH